MRLFSFYWIFLSFYFKFIKNRCNLRKDIGAQPNPPVPQRKKALVGLKIHTEGTRKRGKIRDI